MKKSNQAGLRTWIEVDKKAICSNYLIFRKLIRKNVLMVGVVKSNAYGHNLAEFASELENLGVDMLAVDSIIEALTLRKNGIKAPILVLGYTLPEMFSKALRKNIHITVSSIDGLRAFSKIQNYEQIPVHIKVDTGMHRQGFLLGEIEKVVKIIVSKKIMVAGIYTHFAFANNAKNRFFTEDQVLKLSAWKSNLDKVGYSFIVHAGNTAGTLSQHEAHFDMMRVGAGLYGFWTPKEVEVALGKKLKLKPVLSWKTIISEVKEIPAGSGVGYDLTYKTKNVTRIAVCPVGYWHGYPRQLSNNADVLVCGKRAKVLGRVSMDMIVVDVTDIPRAKVGDEVVLIGHSGKEEIPASELAERSGTSAYEILTRLNPLMKRIYK